MLCLLEGQLFCTETTLQPYHTVEAHSCLINMNMTFDLEEIEELMPQQAWKQLETELETSCCNLDGVHCLYTAVQSIVQSSP